MPPVKKTKSNKKASSSVSDTTKKKPKKTTAKKKKPSSSAKGKTNKGALSKSKIKVRIAGEDFKFKNTEAPAEQESSGEASSDIGVDTVSKFLGKSPASKLPWASNVAASEGDAQTLDDANIQSEEQSEPLSVNPSGNEPSKDEQDEDVQGVVRPMGLYKKISFFFIFLTIILILGVAYLMLVSVSIVVTPKSERVSDKLIVNIFDQAKNQVSDFSGVAKAGEVTQAEISQEKVYPATGEDVLGREIDGTVTLINTTNSSQVLVATTRLLTKDDKLFRIDRTVTVPANGELEVGIYADEPNEEMAIAPTTFTIPGLWAGLQDKIYAESKERFTFSKKIKTYVLQRDIDNGVEDLKKELMKSVAQQYGDNYKGNDQVIYEIDQNSIEIELGAKADEEVDSFSIKIDALVNIVAFKADEVEQSAYDKLLSVISADKKLSQFNGDDLKYSLSNYNFGQGVATIEASFSGTVIFHNTDELIDKKKLVGLSESQIINFLEAEDKFEKFEIKFFPAFMKKAPQLADKIKIKVSE